MKIDVCFFFGNHITSTVFSNSSNMQMNRRTHHFRNVDLAVNTALGPFDVRKTGT